MKVFLVVTERDGDTSRESHGTSTEIIREEFFYAAEKIEQVWEETAWMRNTGRTVVGIGEKIPAITILDTKAEVSPVVKQKTGNTGDIKHRLFRVVADQLGYHIEHISLTDGIVSDLGADSLDQVELVMAIEEEFNIELDDDDVRGVITVAGALAVVEQHVCGKENLNK